MFFAKIVNNYPNHNFHAEIYADRSNNNQHDSRKYPKFFGNHREYGCLTVAFQSYPEKGGNGNEKKNILRAVSLF